MAIKLLVDCSNRATAGEVKKQLYEGNPPSPRSLNFRPKQPTSSKDYLVTFRVGNREESDRVYAAKSPATAINSALFKYAKAAGLEPTKFIATHRSSARARPL